MQRILQVIETGIKPQLTESFWEQYKEENLVKRLQVILEEINSFFDKKAEVKTKIASLDFWRVRQLKMKRIVNKIQNKWLNK